MSILVAVAVLAIGALAKPDTNSWPHDYAGKPSGDYSPKWQPYFEVTEPLSNVSFPLARSFAGNIAVNRPDHPNNTLFYWAFEKTNGSLSAQAGERSDEPWGIWLNGGPGSSSMFGMLYENGPIRLKDDYSVRAQNWSWDRLADYFWIDQPVGVGYSTVQNYSFVLNEDEMGTDFLGFLSNLVKVFPSLATRPLHITGESYAGTYIPYITKAYFGSKSPPVKLAKIAIGDGSLNNDAVDLLAPIPVVIETFPQLIGYDPEVYRYFKEQQHLCGYDVNLTYPQTNGTFPALKYNYGPENIARTRSSLTRSGRLTISTLMSHIADRFHKTVGNGGLSKRDLEERAERAQQWKRDLSGRANGTIDTWYYCDLLDEVADYAVNFTFPWNLAKTPQGSIDVYDVPDALLPEVPQDTEVFMNDNRTRAALHAPTSKQFTQSRRYPFNNTGGLGEDPSDVPAVFMSDLASNMTKANISVVIYSGNDDMLVPHWGSEVTIQNTTFGGIQGFTRKPATPWTTDNGTFAGIAHQERNWTYILTYGAGHLIPLLKAEAAYVMAREFIFGRNETGLLLPDRVVGGENATLQGAALPAIPDIYYGSGTTASTYTAPSATIAQWESFISSVTATTTYSAYGNASKTNGNVAVSTSAVGKESSALPLHFALAGCMCMVAVSTWLVVLS